MSKRSPRRNGDRAAFWTKYGMEPADNCSDDDNADCFPGGGDPAGKECGRRRTGKQLQASGGHPDRMGANPTGTGVGNDTDYSGGGATASSLTFPDQKLLYRSPTRLVCARMRRISVGPERHHRHHPSYQHLSGDSRFRRGIMAEPRKWQRLRPRWVGAILSRGGGRGAVRTWGT